MKSRAIHWAGRETLDLDKTSLAARRTYAEVLSRQLLILRSPVVRRGFGRFRFFDLKQLTAQGKVFGSLSVSHQPEVPDPLESVGQNV